MSPTNEQRREQVAEAMDRWRHVPRAFDSFWAHDTLQPTYKLECDLDHQASYIEALFQAWEDHNPHWDLPLRISLEERDILRFEERLAEANADAGHVRELKRYLTATKDLLARMLNESKGSANS